MYPIASEAGIKRVRIEVILVAVAAIRSITKK